jgi:hypothetical protein
LIISDETSISIETKPSAQTPAAMPLPGAGAMDDLGRHCARSVRLVGHSLVLVMCVEDLASIGVEQRVADLSA